VAEQAETERLTTGRGESFAEALSYFPAAIAGAIEPHGYLEISGGRARRSPYR
jgi:hypothetical protein